MAKQETHHLPLVEERAEVSKVLDVVGRVTVRTVTEAQQHVVRQELDSEEAEVSRVAIDREVSTAPEIRTENGVTIIPILEERVVVEKKLFLKEELHIRRRVVRETVEVPITLQQQRAVVERENTGADPSLTTRSQDDA